VLHQHHYTIEQASAVRPWVAQRMQRIRDGHARLLALGSVAREALAVLDPATGGSYPGRQVATCLVEVTHAMRELDAVDIVVRDIARGLIDFPSLRDGEEVYLCWLLDEDEIRFWHEPDAGFAGRRPL
jgi:hypothetical protein